MSTLDSLNDEPIWVSVAEIAEYAYTLLEHLPEEEKWGMESNMRRHAFSLTDDVAEAVGSLDPRDRMRNFGRARSQIYGLKSALTMAKRMSYITLEPEKMVAIEEAISQLDQKYEHAKAEIAPYDAELDKTMLTENKT